MGARFRDRTDAGHQLAGALGRFRGAPDTIVLGLPRGGVPVAHEIARELALPLDVLVVRKVGAPGQPELAMGAVASGGARVVNDDILAHFANAEAVFAVVAEQELVELERRETLYRAGRGPLAVSARTCVIVDDGLATGATMEAAVLALKSLGATRIVVAVPVASGEAVSRLERSADEVVCLLKPLWFRAVGQWYDDFEQTSDAEVAALLADRAAGAASSQPGP
jgi:predicted phosphoribosyltransferase